MAVNPTVFVRQAYDEIKKVTWPARPEVIRLTVSVVIISLIVGLFLGGLDFALTKLLQVLLK
jgi:preprotein translocase subunit SecE